MSNFTVNVNSVMKFMSLRDLMMVDWDPILPGESWDEGHTIYNAEEAIKLLELDCIQHPTHLWRVYKTSSGGVHAFLVSHKLPPTKTACNFSYSLKGDKRYINCSWHQQVWNVRLSPKKGRVNDFVAKYLCTIGTGEFLLDHRTTMIIHDTYLSKYNK